MDRGDLVPDDLIIAMIIERLERAGHRRRASSSTASRAPSAQAEALDEELDAARPHADRRAADRRARGRGRAAAVRAAGVREGPAQLPRRLRPAQAPRPLRHGRQPAGRARRRPPGGGAAPARGVPREDRAADRLLRAAAASCAGSTARAAPTRSATRSARRWRRCGSRSRSRPAMIIRKTPEEIEAMAAAGEIVARCLAMLRGQVPARASRPPSSTARREVHPQPGRRARLQGLPRLPGLDLHLAELDGRARHPGRLRARSAATCSRSTSASSTRAGSPTRRSRSRCGRSARSRRSC